MGFLNIAACVDQKKQMHTLFWTLSLEKEQVFILH